MMYTDDQQEIWASAEQQVEPKIKEELEAQQDNLTESETAVINDT